MRSRIFLLALSLAVMFGGASALAQEETTDEDTSTPETNTVFVATVTLEDETNYLKYRVCSLNDDDGSFANCQAVLDNFDEEDFSWTTLEGVEQIAIETNGDGELNHGSYVSAFAEGYEGQGKGCLLRYIAQSDWGKEDSEVEGSTLLIEAETFCAFNGKPGDGEVEGEDEGNGPPPWAGNGKPDWAGNDDESEVESDEDAGGPPAWAGTPGGPKNADS